MSESQRSEGLTRRDIIKKGAILGGTVMWVTPVVQTVGMNRALAQNPSDTCVPQWAASVVSESQGQRNDGTDVLEARSNSDNALGEPSDGPDGSGEEIFFSLGFGGSLTVMFAERAYVATGSDVLVVETTGGSYPPESARVEVSQNGTDFTSVGTATNQPTSSTTHDLSGIPYSWIQYVRLTDTTNDTDHDADADGFDVNAVGIACNPA